eukprot:scaffold311398_cov46-Prasinocladus_malaysianus.AAC.1
MRWHALLSCCVWPEGKVANVMLCGLKRSQLRLCNGTKAKILVAGSNTEIRINTSHLVTESDTCRTTHIASENTTSAALDASSWQSMQSDQPDSHLHRTQHYMGTVTAVDDVRAVMILDETTEVLLIHFPATAVPGLRAGCQVSRRQVHLHAQRLIN